MKLITTVVVLPMRNPFVVAKQAVTIDQLSGGRLVLGLGAGWNEREFANVHADFHDRGRRFEEALRLLRHLFSGSREPFEGDYYGYEDGVFEPPPAQGGRLPILLGGNSDAAVSRAARAADLWESTGLDPDAWRERVELLRSQAADRTLEAGSRVSLRGSPAEMLERARSWREAGAEHLMIEFGFTDGFAERMRVFAREVMPALRL